MSMRLFENAIKSVTTIKGMKAHPSLSYVLFCIGGGLTIATLYTARLAFYNIDVSENKNQIFLLTFLFFCGGVGCAWASYYTGRLALYQIDVSWRNGDIPNPNERWTQKDQYKFYSPVRDYSKMDDPRPKY